MKPIIRLIRQYPISIAAYLMYGLLWFNLLNVRNRYNVESQLMDAGNRLAFGEGVAYTALFTIFIGIIFILILLLNAASRKEDRKPYLFLCLPVLILTLFLIFVMGI